MYRRSNLKETSVAARAKQGKKTVQQHLEESNNPRIIKDQYNRKRSVNVSFRVSPEQNEKINAAVAISGLPKQEYCYLRCLCQDVVFQGNPRVYKALKDQMECILVQLKRIVAVDEMTPELIETINLIATVLGGLKGTEDNSEK